jgi:hypothetical protein
MMRQPQCVYIHPFSWGEPSETLFYIPPTNKGGVDEGIAGVRPVRLDKFNPVPPLTRVYRDAQRSRFDGVAS